MKKIFEAWILVEAVEVYIGALEMRKFRILFSYLFCFPSKLHSKQWSVTFLINNVLVVEQYLHSGLSLRLTLQAQASSTLGSRPTKPMYAWLQVGKLKSTQLGEVALVEIASDAVTYGERERQQRNESKFNFNHDRARVPIDGKTSARVFFFAGWQHLIYRVLKTTQILKSSDYWRRLTWN